MRLQPTYKAAIKKTPGHKKYSKHVQGGKVMTVTLIQTGTQPSRKGQMLTLADLRRTR